MPQNGYNIGKDATLRINTTAGPLSFPIINFNSKQDTTSQRIKPINGPSANLTFYDGWSGRFDSERVNGALDDYFAFLESAFYAGQNETAGTIDETIVNADGSVSQYRYLGVTLYYGDAGDKSQDKAIHQSVSFLASRRIKL